MTVRLVKLDYLAESQMKYEPLEAKYIILYCEKKIFILQQ